jgi:hypothetical protein
MPDQSWTPIANISLHALARRIERGAERDHAALVRDLSVLVQADEGSARVNTQRRLLAGQCDGGAERLRQAEHSAARCEDMAGQLTAMHCPVFERLLDPTPSDQPFVVGLAQLAQASKMGQLADKLAGEGHPPPGTGATQGQAIVGGGPGQGVYAQLWG